MESLEKNGISGGEHGISGKNLESQKTWNLGGERGISGKNLESRENLKSRNKFRCKICQKPEQPKT